MPRTSAGLLMYRRGGGALEVFLIHMGGPFWANKDAGAWSLPKGEYKEAEEAPLDAARREFHEETGFTAAGPFLPLGTIRQKGGKFVTAWAFEGDCDPAQLRSNTKPMQWPPNSGEYERFPEVDRGAWMTPHEAREKIIQGQVPLIDELERILSEGHREVA